MLTIDSIVLYVESVQLSMAFYEKVFECEPKLLSPTFAVVEFAENVKITLKQADGLTPSSLVRGGGTELSIPVINSAELDTLFENWKQQGVNFAQEREESVYGINFVALDSDGHRLRVFA
ncbi:VOC family protein [Photobacterium rosenbergii]|uniref:VOC family protein n=1 Tax=Photobacterium rosenbergii TaxID=294936 RepID=UPI001C9928A3|nr:VOC family protein [Photobacterium rosenbergii]MBY5948400.1 glyoxalase [Photobacterium rosenbergii]